MPQFKLSFSLIPLLILECSCIFTVPKDLPDLMEFLNMKNVTMLCPKWNVQDFKSLSEKVSKTFILNSRSNIAMKSEPKALIICPEHFENQTILEGLLSSKPGTLHIPARLVLFTEEKKLADLKAVEEAPIDQPIYHYNLETLSLTRLFCINGTDYRQGIGTFDVNNKTAILQLYKNLRGVEHFF